MGMPGLRPGKGRFLHVIPDNKFIDAAHDIFEEAAPDAHDYLIFSSGCRLRYIHNFEPIRVSPAQILDACLRLDEYSAVFIHYLNNEARLLIHSAPAHTKFIWLAWGADYYHLLGPENTFLLPSTLAMLAGEPISTGRNFANFLAEAKEAAMAPAHFLHRLKLRRRTRAFCASAPAETTLLRRFSALATPIEEDYLALRAHHPSLDIPFLDWNYWTENFSPRRLPTRPTGNNILLGNSATPTNNHLDALELLADAVPHDRTVICPLSYGLPRYADLVEEKGHALLGNRFVPLREYTNSESYAKTISSCSIVIMNHLRQQALGNIIIALCSGSHLFLQAGNPVRATLSKMGITTNEIAEVPGFLQKESSVPDAELKATRTIIEAKFGRAAILEKTKRLLQAFPPS